MKRYLNKNKQHGQVARKKQTNKKKTLYCANATKQFSYDVPNSTQTSLKTSGAQPFGVMRPKCNFMVTTINAVWRRVNTTYAKKYTISTVKLGCSGLCESQWLRESSPNRWQEHCSYQKILEDSLHLSAHMEQIWMFLQ